MTEMSFAVFVQAQARKMGWVSFLKALLKGVPEGEG
jgi:hypothetical protein